MPTIDFAQPQPPHGEVARIWPRFLLFPTTAIGGYAGLINHWGGEAWWMQGLWVALLTYSWFCVGGVFHECAHQTLGKARGANIWAGRIIGTILGIPYTVFRECHRYHHSCMNTPQDWEMWPYSDPRSSLTFRRAFVWFDIFAGVIAAPVIFGRIYWTQSSPLPLPVRRVIYKEYLAIAFVWIAGIAIFAWLAVAGAIEPRHFNVVWILPLVIAPMLNTLRKFSEHLGMASNDPILGTRTVVADNFLTRVFSYFDFELCVHGPHHRHPRLSRDHLASNMQRYIAAHPQKAVPVFSSHRQALADAWPCLFRNPGVGVNAQ